MMADKIAGGVLIHAVFNESDGSKPGNLPSNPQSLGFVYSTGVARSGDTNYEFIWFGRRNLVERVHHTMNYLASRIKSGHAVSDGQLVESGPNIIWKINAVSENRNQELLDEYAVKCRPATTMLELTTGALPLMAGDTCFVEYVPPPEHDQGDDEDEDEDEDDVHIHVGGGDGSMLYLSRELPSGRIIRVDTENGNLLKGGISLAAVDMNYNNIADGNIECVDEKTARQMLMAFEE